MRIPYFRLTSLFFIASVTAHAYYPPVGLKPRYLSTGTGISLSLPTNSANGTATVSPGTIYLPPSSTPTAPVTPISTPSSSSSSSTAPPTSTSPSSSSAFHLIAAGTGTSLDGSYLFVNGARGAGAGDLQVTVFTTQLPPPESLDLATFHHADNGTLVDGSGGAGKAFGAAADNYWFFNRNPILETAEVFESVCEIMDGVELKCVMGPNTVFYICVEVLSVGLLTGSRSIIGI